MNLFYQTLQILPEGLSGQELPLIFFSHSDYLRAIQEIARTTEIYEQHVGSIPQNVTGLYNMYQHVFSCTFLLTKKYKIVCHQTIQILLYIVPLRGNDPKPKIYVQGSRHK